MLEEVKILEEGKSIIGVNESATRNGGLRRSKSAELTSVRGDLCYEVFGLSEVL